MKENQLSDEQIDAILNAFRDAIDNGPWATSAFLRVLGKKLQEIFDEFESHVDVHQEAVAAKKEEHHSRKKPTESQQEVFIALYSSDGANFKTWEHIISNLPKQLVSRPVYEAEEPLKNAIRARENAVNEGYVVAYIPASSILAMPEDRMAKDKFGNILLSLKDKALSLEHVVRFVHVSGIYAYTHGRLVKDTGENTA